MRRMIAWCVAGLPFEPRSRRAIDDTLADWAHEEQAAPTRGCRTRAGVQGILSIARVVSISVIRETIDPGWCRGLARRWGVVAAAVMLLALTSAAPMADALGPGTLTFAVLSVPLVLLAVLPPAIFLMFAWRPVSRAMPTAGTACVLAAVVLALAGWLVPLSSDVLNDVLRPSLVLDATIGSDYPPPLSRSEALLAVTGWACLAGATAICAAMVARRSPIRNRWWLAGVPAIYVALIPVFTYTIGTSFLVFQSAGDPSVGFRPGIAAWTTSALLMTAAMTYGRTVYTPAGAVSAD
jgi:hypothetical protein